MTLDSPPARTTMRIAATDAAVARGMGAIERFLDGAGVAEGDRIHAAIVLGEVLNNIVEHAYAGRPGAGIALSAAVEADRLVIVLADTGLPMPDRRLPEGRLPGAAGNLAALPEGGFGWHLIRALTDELRYVRKAGSNRLHLHIPIGAGTLA